MFIVQRLPEARGVVIVIDVIRAFTVAAYACAGGAKRLWLVRSTDEAFALRQQEPQALLAGEIGGRLIPGFDLNNSPSLVAATNVQGRTIIQRTGAGTQGAVGAINAAHLLVCSLANARATASYARELASTVGGIVTLLPTEGSSQQKPFSGEDAVCADYLEALLCRAGERAGAAGRQSRAFRGVWSFRLHEARRSGFPI